MLIAPAFDDLDYQSLVNWDDPLCQGLACWGLNLPGRWGGSRAYCLTTGRAMTRTNMASPPTSTSGPGTTTRPGGWGEERFDGSNDYIDLGVAPSRNPSAITVSAMMRAAAFSNAYSAIVSKRITTAGYQLFVKNDGRLAVYLYCTGGGPSLDTTTAVLSVGVWYSTVLTYDATSGLRVYVNGVLYGSAAAAGGLIDVAGITAIGTDLETPSRYFSGSIDDVCLYDRALSSGEVLTLYEDSRLGHPRMLRRVGVPMWRGADGFAEIVGTASLTQVAQTLSSSATLALAGTLTSTQAGQTLSSTAGLTIVGAAALVQADATLSSAGALAIGGSASVTQAEQSISSAGALALAGAGAAAATQAPQTLSSTGALVAPGAGQAVLTQADQSVNSAGALALAGAASVTQAEQTLSSTGALVAPNSGQATLTQAPQTLSSAALLLLRGSASLVQDDHTLLGTDTLGILGTLDVTQASQTLSAMQHMTLIAARTFTVEAEDRTYIVGAVA